VVPPDKHAARIVSELVQRLVEEQIGDSDRLADTWCDSADGSPKAQCRLVERIKCQRMRSLIEVKLTPGKRGRYSIYLVEWYAWDPARDAPIDRVPSTVRLNFYESKGRGNYDATGRLLAPITHHSLFRLVQRFGARWLWPVRWAAHSTIAVALL
jgi:hypothetical protein